VGLVGTVALLLLIAIFRRPILLSAGGAFVGLTLGGGLRWWNATPDSDDTRAMHLLLGLGVLAVGAVVVLTATIGRWVHQEPSSFRPTPYEHAPATMVVLCETTSRGSAYTYQTVATEKPTCRNGAVPKVVVRG
jgi:hypothetical protein